MSNRTRIVIALVILAITAGLSIWQGTVLQANRIQVQTLNEEAANLRGVQETLKERHQGIKLEVTESRLESEQDLALIFPTQEEITSLNRIFDDFSTKNNFDGNPFFISSVTYGGSQAGPQNEFQVVPITMSLKTSKKNLYRFIDYVNNSGSLESGVRLMSIESMSVSYPSLTNEFGVNLSLNAYYSRDI